MDTGKHFITKSFYWFEPGGASEQEVKAAGKQNKLRSDQNLLVIIDVFKMNVDIYIQFLMSGHIYCRTPQHGRSRKRDTVHQSS